MEIGIIFVLSSLISSICREVITKGSLKRTDVLKVYILRIMYIIDKAPRNDKKKSVGKNLLKRF